MPADGGAHCGVLWLGADSAGSFGSAKRVPAIIDEPCGDPQIIPVNADDDEFTDLALLTGSRDARRSPLVRALERRQRSVFGRLTSRWYRLGILHKPSPCCPTPEPTPILRT